MFTTKPVLAIPNIDREMRVEADASDYATGGVLLTKYKDGVRATGHKTLGESSVDITDCNYDTTHLQENPQRLG